MKSLISRLVYALCLTLFLSQTATAQTPENRPRRVAPVAFSAPQGAPSLTATPTTLESRIPRAGLRFYFEARHGGLNELAKAPGVAKVFTKLLPAKGIAAGDLTGFLVNNLGALSRSRLVMVSYGADQEAVLIEAASPGDASQLEAGIAKLRGAEMAVSTQGQVVMAGASTVVSRLTQNEGGSLAEDQEFLKAQARFAADPLFGFMEMSAMMLPWQGMDAPAGSPSSAAMLGLLGGMPSAIALGGSIEGEITRVRALMLHGKPQQGGLFASLLAAAREGEAKGASFATPDTSMFFNVMIDWDKLYEAITGIFAGFAGASVAPQSGAQAEEMLAKFDTFPGFSIRNDLLPTLGNEIAITMSGFERFMGRGAASSRAAVPPKAASPKFALMVELRDPLKFEELFGQLVRKMSGPNGREFAQATHRGARIRYGKGLAYAISGDFLLVGGSVSEIQRALDAHATGESLAASADFRAALGAPRPVMAQAYFSAAVTGRLFEGSSATARGRAPVGIVVTSDADGSLMEMQLPTSLSLTALAALAEHKPSAYGIQPSASTSTVTRTGGRRTPKMMN